VQDLDFPIVGTEPDFLNFPLKSQLGIFEVEEYNQELEVLRKGHR